MKPLHFFIAALACLSHGSCKKDTPAIQPPVGGSPVTNTAPVVEAGADIQIYYPQSSVLLAGKYEDKERNVQKVEWVQLSGPNTSNIGHNDAAQTLVTDLIAGVYQFEFTATDKAGLYGKDTVQVTLFDHPLPPVESPNIIMGTHEVTFKSLTWFYPWYNTLEVQNIYSYVPYNTPIKVFIQRYSTDWVEVPLVSDSPTGEYEYSIETRPGGAGMYGSGSLYVFYYGTNTFDSPSLKVQF